MGIWILATDTCCPVHWRLSAQRGCQESKEYRLMAAESLSLNFVLQDSKADFLLLPKSSRRASDSSFFSHFWKAQKWVLGEWARHLPLSALIAPPPPGETLLSPTPSFPPWSLLCQKAPQILVWIASWSPASPAWLLYRNIFKKSNLHNCLLLCSNFLLTVITLSALSWFIPLLKKLSFLLPPKLQPREFSG